MDDDTTSESNTIISSDTTGVEVSSENTSSEEVSSTSPINVEDIVISDDWSSWQIAVEGNVYTMPCYVSEFEKNGWELKNAEGTLKSNQYTLGQDMKKGDQRISVQIINLSDNEVNIADGQVGKVKVSLLDKVHVVLPGGLVFDENLTVEDVKAKYGEPKDVAEGDNYVTLTYQNRAYEGVEFCFYDKDSSMSQHSYVYVRNFNA